MKEIKLKARIEEHDYQVKMRKAIEFLSRGDKLKLTLTLRGREMIRQDLGRKTLSRMIEDLKDLGQADGSFRTMGRRITILVVPHSIR